MFKSKIFTEKNIRNVAFFYKVITNSRGECQIDNNNTKGVFPEMKDFIFACNLLTIYAKKNPEAYANKLITRWDLQAERTCVSTNYIDFDDTGINIENRFIRQLAEGFVRTASLEKEHACAFNFHSAGENCLSFDNQENYLGATSAIRDIADSCNGLVPRQQTSNDEQ